MITRRRLVALLEEIRHRRVALLGDLFLDWYLEVDGDRDEPSLETRLPAYQVTGMRASPGALGTVLNNVHALDVGTILPVTVIGDDGAGYVLRQLLTPLLVVQEHVVVDATRMTPVYTKPMRREHGGPEVELSRLDIRTRAPLSPPTEASILAHLTSALQIADGLIVLDQVPADGEGVVNAAIQRHLSELAAAHPETPIIIDSRGRIHTFTFGTLKMNLSECLRGLNSDDARDPDSLTLDEWQAAATELSARNGLPVVVTNGGNGIVIVRPGKKLVYAPGITVEGPIDIVGAGDSVTAALMAAWLAGASDAEAATLANIVASITIQQIGTTGTASPEQILHRWDEVNAA